MAVIWKSVLEQSDVQEIEVPAGAEMLCAREQHGQVAVWYRCDPDAPKETRKLALCGTGHQAPSRDQSRYLGTASLHGGELIVHVFEQT
jgi:hypothetical protein